MAAGYSNIAAVDCLYPEKLVFSIMWFADQFADSDIWLTVNEQLSAQELNHMESGACGDTFRCSGGFVHVTSPWTAACSHHCPEWREPSPCTGRVPATANTEILLNIAALLSHHEGKHQGLGELCSPERHSCTRRHSSHIWLCAPSTFIIRAATLLLQQRPALHSLSSDRLCTNRPTAFCTQPERGYATMEPRAPNLRRGFRPGTKFCYALTSIDIHSQSVSQNLAQSSSSIWTNQPPIRKTRFSEELIQMLHSLKRGLFRAIRRRLSCNNTFSWRSWGYATRWSQYIGGVFIIWTWALLFFD